MWCQSQIVHILSLGKPYRMKKKLCLTKKINKDDVLPYLFHVFKNSFPIYLIILEENFYIYTHWYEITYPL